MIIKSFDPTIVGPEDIRNISYRRRLVIIYDYKSPHLSETLLYGNGEYDVYVLNVSTIDGVDFLIPKGVELECKNSYRGVACNAINQDGTINYNSAVRFHNGYFASTVKHGLDKIGLLKPSMLYGGDTTREDEFCYITKSDVVIPTPIYYNMEDQARLGSGYIKDCDFDMNIYDVPTYSLSDFRDPYTRFIIFQIDDDNLIGGRADINNIFGPYSDGIDVDTYRQSICRAFIKAYEAVALSIFSQVFIVFDTDNGTFNIDTKSLKLKFGRNKSPSEITKGFAWLVTKIAPIADNELELLLPYQVDLMDPSSAITPTRLTFYISDIECRIRLSSITGSDMGILI
jgi:hypothetical protein